MDEREREAGEEMAAWRTVMQRPEFARAARALAGAMLQAGDEDGRLCAVCRDAGAYVTAMSALYLDAAGGMTLPQLKDICEGSGFLSRGRARSLLQVLVHFGWLLPVGTARPVVYRPTPAFVAAWRRHLRLALLAAAVLEPALASLADWLEEPEALPAFMAVQAGRLHRLAQGPDPLPELRNAFLHPYAGSQVMWSLVVSDQGHDFPSGGTVTIPLGRMAARFGVARVQVRRVLVGAEREGLLHYEVGGGVRFLEAGREGVRLHFASQLSELMATGAIVLAARAGQF